MVWAELDDDPDNISLKNANFSKLSDLNNPDRKTICSKERHVNTKLKQISVDLERYRNFMMHSDDSKVTKVDTEEEGIALVNEIFKEINDIFSYFDDVFS